MIDDKIFNKLEKLSYLKIDNKENIKNQINEILKFMDNLNQIKIKEDIKIDFMPLKLRDDIVINNQDGKEIIKSAPKTIDNFFIVPKIIE